MSLLVKALLIACFVLSKISKFKVVLQMNLSEVQCDFFFVPCSLELFL